MWLINTALLLLTLCLFMVFMILVDKYNKNHNLAVMAFNDMEASRYRMLTEQYKSETARHQLEMSDIKLRAFLKMYWGMGDE